MENRTCTHVVRFKEILARKSTLHGLCQTFSFFFLLWTTNDHLYLLSPETDRRHIEEHYQLPFYDSEARGGVHLISILSSRPWTSFPQSDAKCCRKDQGSTILVSILQPKQSFSPPGGIELFELFHPTPTTDTLSLIRTLLRDASHLSNGVDRFLFVVDLYRPTGGSNRGTFTYPRFPLPPVGHQCSDSALLWHRMSSQECCTPQYRFKVRRQGNSRLHKTHF